MFGFERNESNSLEQLCVNWTAEKLQHYYTQTVFNDTLKACELVTHIVDLFIYCLFVCLFVYLFMLEWKVWIHCLRVMYMIVCLVLNLLVTM